MDVRNLSYILEIAQQKSITKAAESLFVSQSSLSQCLLKLEQEVGTELFIRKKNQLLLTQAGQLYVEAARRVVQIQKQLYLLARPVFVSTQKHIQAHFLICFVALLILRMIQHAMGSNSLSAERIARALNAANGKVKRGGYVDLDDVGGSMAFEKRKNKKGKLVDTLVFSDMDEIAQDYQLIQRTFGTDFYQVDVKQEAFNRFLKKIRYPS